MHHSSSLAGQNIRDAFAPFRDGPVYLPVDAAERRYRPVSRDEFMYMDTIDTSEGRVHRLKHRGTRNYLEVHPGGHVVVPVADAPFFRGFYGEAPEGEVLS